jgi:hypothetical protein
MATRPVWGPKKAAKKACRLLRTFCTIVLGGKGIAFSPGSNWVASTSGLTVVVRTYSTLDARTFQNYEEQIIQIENDADLGSM